MGFCLSFHGWVKVRNILKLQYSYSLVAFNVWNSCIIKSKYQRVLGPDNPNQEMFLRILSIKSNENIIIAECTLREITII